MNKTATEKSREEGRIHFNTAVREDLLKEFPTKMISEAWERKKKKKNTTSEGLLYKGDSMSKSPKPDVVKKWKEASMTEI